MNKIEAAVCRCFRKQVFLKKTDSKIIHKMKKTIQKHHFKPQGLIPLRRS